MLAAMFPTVRKRIAVIVQLLPAPARLSPLGGVLANELHTRGAKRVNFKPGNNALQLKGMWNLTRLII